MRLDRAASPAIEVPLQDYVPAASLRNRAPVVHPDLPGELPAFDDPRQREREAWRELLSAEPWHWFCTLTFRRDHERASGGIHPEKADKAFRFFVRNLNESLYGNRWMRHAPHGGVVWARGQEFHKDGKIHFHAVMAAPDRDLNTCSRYYWHEWWYREFGRNQIERPECQGDVVGYVSKYVTKDGEVDLSRNFGEAKPPRLFEVEPEAQRVTAPLSGLSIGRPGEGTAGAPVRVVRSLTPPVRPESVQDRFTDESFFEPDLRDLDHDHDHHQ